MSSPASACHSKTASDIMNAALMHSGSALASKVALGGRPISTARAPAARVAQPLGVRASVVGDGPLGDRWCAPVYLPSGCTRIMNPIRSPAIFSSFFSGFWAIKRKCESSTQDLMAVIRPWTRYTVSQPILMPAHARICLDSLESGYPSAQT